MLFSILLNLCKAKKSRISIARWELKSPIKPSRISGVGCFSLRLAPCNYRVVIGSVVEEFKRLKYKREFAENVLNPKYLRGTGLGILSDLSAVLIAKSRVPSYVFEKEDITRIVLHEEAYQYGSSDYELYVHLSGFHALTIYGFDEGDSKNIVRILISLYDIEFKYTSHYNAIDTSGGGGGGG